MINWYRSHLGMTRTLDDGIGEIAHTGVHIPIPSKIVSSGRSGAARKAQ